MFHVLTGFIYQEKFEFGNEDIEIVSYIPVETIGAKVYHMVFNFLPKDVVILASCNRLVYCGSCFPLQEPTLYNCNPSIKEWIKDENRDERLYLAFELYSSETGAWRKSNEICQCNNNLIKNKGIYIEGVLHWLTDGDQVLTFGVEKELSWLISIPIPTLEFRTIPEACIGESEGKLHYVLVSEEGLHVWYLEDYYEFKWTLKHYKSLEEIEGEYPRFFLNLKNRVLQRVSVDTNPWMNPLGFKDGVLLMKMRAHMYMYDINNNKMAQACSIEDLNSKCTWCPTILPHSLSLVPLNHGDKVPFTPY
ncbi:uncharacterized protein LOC133307711 [Gastrolobium bilobum]|uniref:uncharacterized protein LOC133307711 n=1 Tax=Gastrolobium bilobum TaxID=150636 RepID=UPI002AB2ED2C|nr:uncharacterized protein LOC133307711 [Gastrolobium bilobum]